MGVVAKTYDKAEVEVQRERALKKNLFVAECN